MHLDSEESAYCRQHILAIDNDAAFLELVTDLFESEGYVVSTLQISTEPAASIALIEADLLLLGLIPGMPACWDVLTTIHAELMTRQMPVLVTSTDERLLHQASHNPEVYGHPRTLAKPMELDELLEAVRGLIGPGGGVHDRG